MRGLSGRHFICPAFRYLSTETQLSQVPPRILFFGTDSFSLASLRKLCEAKQRNSEVYNLLDVFTRKPYNKKGTDTYDRLNEIRKTATQYNLKFQMVDKASIKLFKVLPSEYDLVIAVSFGLFIPKSILQNIPWSINVHPSLLPQYRGPAPIHHAIYNGDKVTGITLQTLSTEAFDKGLVFEQTPPIPIGEYETLDELWNRLAEIGAKLLVDVVENRKYVNPKPIETSTEESYAPSLQIDRKVADWNEMTAEQLVRLSRLGSVGTGIFPLHRGKRKVSIGLRGLRLRNKAVKELEKREPGNYFLERQPESGKLKMVVCSKDGGSLWVEEVIVEGKPISGLDFVKSSKDRFIQQRFVAWGENPNNSSEAKDAETEAKDISQVG